MRRRIGQGMLAALFVGLFVGGGLALGFGQIGLISLAVCGLLLWIKVAVELSA